MKTILITGCNGGIGKGMVKYFKKREWYVIGVDIDDNIEEYMDMFINCDISNISNIDLIVDKLKDIEHIDVLVNNAAIQIKKEFKDINYVDWIKSLETNLISPFFIVQKLLDKLEIVKGMVFNIGSIHSNLSKKDFLLYATTKGALKTMTQNMALEIAPNVKVNCILPAAIDTPMLKAGLSEDEYNELKKYHPARDIGYPEDVAKLIELLSKNSGFLTGSMIEFDGGISKLLHDPGNK